MCAVVGLCVSCSNTAEPASEPVLQDVALIDHSAWKMFPAERDPLIEHQPDELDCGLAGWYVEGTSDTPLLELDTNYCNYALLEHAAISGVGRGDRVSLELRHYDLRALEPAEAHVAVLFGDELEWETWVTIPGDADVQVHMWSARHDLRAGEPIRLHLHNHGQNTWIVGSVRAEVLVRE